jgi:uncharacterized protein (DUF2132 family)
MADKEVRPQPNDPLHGITLKTIVMQLRDHYGWEDLADMIEIDCFYKDPSVRSSLKFLRKPTFIWARKKVEALYLETDFDDIDEIEDKEE